MDTKTKSLTELMETVHEYDINNKESLKHAEMHARGILSQCYSRVRDLSKKITYKYGIEYPQDFEEPNHIISQQVMGKIANNMKDYFYYCEEFKVAVDSIDRLCKKVEKELAIACDQKIDSIVKTIEK